MTPFRRLALLGLTFLTGLHLFKTLAFVAPAVITDWSIRDTAVPTAKYRLEDTNCRSIQLILQTCTMTIEYTSEGQVRVRPLIYVFFAPYSRQVAYRIFADPLKPDRVTTDIGLMHLVNRSITLIAAILLLGPFFAACALVSFGVL